MNSTLVTIKDGYQLCADCGHVMVNDQQAWAFELGPDYTLYWHPKCKEPAQVKKAKRVLKARKTQKLSETARPDCEGNMSLLSDAACEAEANVVEHYQREGVSISKNMNVDGQIEEVEVLSPTGKRRNGIVYLDLKEYAKQEHLDLPAGMTLGVIAITQDILKKERANLYRTVSIQEYEQMKKQDLNFAGSILEMRTSVGKDKEQAKEEGFLQAVSDLE